MNEEFDLSRFQDKAKSSDRYANQLTRLGESGIAIGCIEEAVNEAMQRLAGRDSATAIVIYGEPQSGKTEMMICLTAKLLDEGHRLIIHLLNDSLDLLSQSLKRFMQSGLAPAPQNASTVVQSSASPQKSPLVVFCKKNARDLETLNEWLKKQRPIRVVVVDDEADFATPNSKVNQGKRTKINSCINDLLGADGVYIGVTATPARLDLNKTFDNNAGDWVHFPPHEKYTGQDVFFPLTQTGAYRLKLLNGALTPTDVNEALVRFLVSAAYLNSFSNGKGENYTMLVHTSGKKLDHEADRAMVDSCVRKLLDSDAPEFEDLVRQVFDEAKRLYGSVDANVITEYVVKNASRTTLLVLNSERDRKAAGDSPTEPTSPFTIIFGGNIVSRGVTFPNLLSMFFTRNVTQRLQQDTYIQRARMFGARGGYLSHFELTIPRQLYADWLRCFIFHRLALETIKTNIGAPVWIADNRVAVASGASINRATVILDKGEMSFAVFDFDSSLDDLIRSDPSSLQTLQKLRGVIGDDALPPYLINYIDSALTTAGGTIGLLAIHTASSIAGSADANQTTIERSKGFMGQTQLEARRFPNAVHHIKIFYNAEGKARLFYKLKGNIQFIQNPVTV